MATDSFERALDAWWYDFEVRCKRDLELAQTNALLDEVKKASNDLARRTKQLILNVIAMIQQTTGHMPTVGIHLKRAFFV
jgi:hypothetical protein